MSKRSKEFNAMTEAQLNEKLNNWRLLAGPTDSKAAVDINQDAKIYATKLLSGQSLDFTLERSRHAWLQVASGSIAVNGTRLDSGDAVASSQATSLHVRATTDSDVLLFDLA